MTARYHVSHIQNTNIEMVNRRNQVQTLVMWDQGHVKQETSFVNRRDGRRRKLEMNGLEQGAKDMGLTGF